MRWSPGSRGNIEDARGRSGFGMGGGIPIGIGGVVVLLVLSWATGTDFLSLLDAERTQLAAEDGVARAEASVFTGVVGVYEAFGGAGQ